MKPLFGRSHTPGASELGVRSPSLEETERKAVTAEFEGTEDDLPPVETSHPTNSVPVRPDLGPPAPGPQSANQPGSGLGLVISIAVSAIVFVLAIYATGSPTANPLPLAQTTNALFWAVAAVATLGSGIGAVFADRTASRSHRTENDETPPGNTAWIVPVIATAAAVILVATFHNTTMIVAGPLIAFLGNAGSLLSRDLLDDADDSAQQTATTIQALVIHSVAFLALSAIYLNKLATPTTTILAGIIGMMLAVEALDRSSVVEARKLVLAFLVGGAVAAAVAPLMWWPTHGWTGGAVLFVVFYCAVGVMQTALEHGNFRIRDAIEYGLVPLAAFLILAVTA
ncbi:MAG TPA: hypothetical protein VK356_02570 [Thermomicrobiales bacterium]|nr:hypothetical protein [Thermomicrobiales bacterium]